MNTHIEAELIIKCNHRNHRNHTLHTISTWGEKYVKTLLPYLQFLTPHYANTFSLTLQTYVSTTLTHRVLLLKLSNRQEVFLGSHSPGQCVLFSELP